MSANPEMRVFIVNTGALATLHANRIEAAYYRHEAGFTTFNDADHKSVFTIRDTHLISVERIDGAEPVIAAFTEALQRADEEGSATVGFRNGDTAETETGYDITVTRFGVRTGVTTNGPVTGSDELAAAVHKASKRNDVGRV